MYPSKILKKRSPNVSALSKCMTLSDKIYALDSFQRQLKALIKLSVSHALGDSLRSEELGLFADRFEWNKLLLFASVLSHSENPDHQDAALRIAQNCLTSTDTKDNQKRGAAVILHKLTNVQALDLAISRDHVSKDVFAELPLPFRLEQIKRDTENVVTSSDGKIFHLNSFQRDFYRVAKESNLVSASAPTSAGKSFVLNLFVTDHLQTDKSINIAYLVPTRALINQLEKDFSDILSDRRNRDIQIVSVPQLPERSRGKKSNLLIFTQERLHWFLTENPEFKIDFLVVDEAQKINDGARGILLQQKIEELNAKFPDLRVLFCSALTENPGELLRGLSENKTPEVVISDYIAVNQNLIWVSKVDRKPKEWNVKFCYKKEDIPLGKIYLEKAIEKEPEKLAQFAFLMGSNQGGNMVYVNSQNEAEETAKALVEILPRDFESKDKDIENLIELSKTLVHPHYDLGNVLIKGVAFHYGHMPLPLKTAIEDLFKQGKIKYLICTSTLLEGVNLPAKNIFLKNPSRGVGNPISDSDFWNLAGRAGRLKKEFQGNIICIDPEEWNPPRERTRYKITRAVTEFSKDRTGLMEYIKNDTPRDKSKENFEYIMSYFFVKFVKNGTLSDLGLDVDLAAELEAEFDRIKTSLEIPDDIITRNPGISPVAMQKLFEYFKSYDENPEKNIEDLIPIMPEDELKAAEHYVRIIHTINSLLSGDFNHGGLNFYRAILVTDWIRGYPLPRIINTGFPRYKKYKPKTTLSSFIRKTMHDIEDEVRFRFAKYSSCYSDILKFYLNKYRPELVERVPELNIALEFGVSQKTHISLIKLGLNRHSAIEIGGLIGKSNLSEEECVKWLFKNDMSVFEISESVKKEINDVKDKIEKEEADNLL